MSTLNVLSTFSSFGPNESDSVANERQPVVGATNVNFNLLAPPTPLTPTEHSSGVTDAQSLTWSAFGAPSVYVLDVSSATASYALYTASPSFALAKLTKASMPLPAGTTFTWNIEARTAASMDDFLGTSGPDAGSAVSNDCGSYTQTFSTP